MGFSKINTQGQSQGRVTISFMCFLKKRYTRRSRSFFKEQYMYCNPVADVNPVNPVVYT